MKVLPYVISTLLLAVGGCATPATADNDVSASTRNPVASHLIVSDWVNGDDGMLALNTGELVTQPDGCVGLQVPGAPKPILLSWPAGSSLSDDAKSVLGSSGKQYRFGDTMGLGGGFGGRAAPRECDRSSWGGVFEVQQPL